MYITDADLVVRYGLDWLIDVADRDGDGIPDPDVVAAAIQDAVQVVDTQIGIRYMVPVTNPTGIIVQVTCALTRYFLHFDPPDHVRDAYKAGLATLDDIRAGRLPLPLTSAAAPSNQHPGGTVQGVADAVVVTKSFLAGF